MRTTLVLIQRFSMLPHSLRHAKLFDLNVKIIERLFISEIGLNYLWSRQHWKNCQNHIFLLNFRSIDMYICRCQSVFVLSFYKRSLFVKTEHMRIQIFDTEVYSSILSLHQKTPELAYQYFQYNWFLSSYHLSIHQLSVSDNQGDIRAKLSKQNFRVCRGPSVKILYDILYHKHRGQ